MKYIGELEIMGDNQSPAHVYMCAECGLSPIRVKLHLRCQ
jgi:hypothetical protein